MRSSFQMPGTSCRFSPCHGSDDPAVARQPVVGGLRSQARQRVRHLAALAAQHDSANFHSQSTPAKVTCRKSEERPHTCATEFGLQRPKGLLDTVAVSLAEQQIQAGADVSVISASHPMHAPTMPGSPPPRQQPPNWRRSIYKPQTAPTPLHSTSSGPASFKNSLCPFSSQEIENGIMMSCGHRFSMDHLGTAISTSRRMEIAPVGYLVCQLCGETQRYSSLQDGPGDDTLSQASVAPSMFSDGQRAVYDNPLTRNWNAEITLPVNA